MWQPATTNSVARLRRSSKAFPKDKLCVHTHTKGHSHCLVAWCQSDPLQLSESWWNHYIWEVCSANQWDAPKTLMPAADTGQQIGSNSPWQYPTARCTPSASEVGQIGLRSSAPPAIFTGPLTNKLPLLQTSQQLFAGKTFLQPGCRNMLSKSSSNPEAQIFMLQE